MPERREFDEVVTPSIDDLEVLLLESANDAPHDTLTEAEPTPLWATRHTVSVFSGQRSDTDGYRSHTLVFNPTIHILDRDAVEETRLALIEKGGRYVVGESPTIGKLEFLFSTPDVTVGRAHIHSLAGKLAASGALTGTLDKALYPLFLTYELVEVE